jgi:hypothetical protein
MNLDSLLKRKKLCAVDKNTNLWRLADGDLYIEMIYDPVIFGRVYDDFSQVAKILIMMGKCPDYSAAYHFLNGGSHER